MSYREFVHSIFEEINFLRTEPKAYAEKLESEFKFYKENNVRYRPGTVPLQTREGLRAIEEAHIELINSEPLGALEISQGLTLAALDHCEDTGHLGIVGHIGSKETSLQKRIELYGKWTGNLVEALDYSSLNAFEVVSSLLIDDGLATRPHRRALLNPVFTKVGVGASPHTEFKTVVCVLFAANYTDGEDLRLPQFSKNPMAKNPEIDGWLEGAVKVTCEVREENRNGTKVKKIKKHWQMADGTTRTTDEEIVDAKKHEEGKLENKSDDSFIKTIDDEPLESFKDTSDVREKRKSSDDSSQGSGGIRRKSSDSSSGGKKSPRKD